jgi:rSAM/selenodomain-associated transferase 2
VERPPFSFVIPVLNEQDSIVSLLQNLTHQYPECELVVVDGGSSDETVARALPLCSNLLTGPPSRATQMNLGARAASGRYIFFLHADTLPSSDMAQLSTVLATRPRWGFFRARLSGERWVYRVIESAMNLRSRITRVATGDQTLFVYRDVLAETGGYADIPLMEDIEFCKRLRRLYPPAIISQPVVTSSRRWETRGVCRTVLQMWALRLAYVLGVSPHRLWQHYYGR